MATGNIDGVSFDYVQTEKGYKAKNQVVKGKGRVREEIEIPVGAYVKKSTGPFWIDTNGSGVPNTFDWGRTANAAIKHGFKVGLDIKNKTFAATSFVYFWK